MIKHEFIILEKNEQLPIETIMYSDLVFRWNDDNTLSIVKNRWVIKTKKKSIWKLFKLFLKGVLNEKWN